jgi:hypothetical protein
MLADIILSLDTASASSPDSSSDDDDDALGLVVGDSGGV